MLFEVSSTMPMRSGRSVGWLNEVISCCTSSSKTLKSSLFKSVTSFSRLVTTLNRTSTRLTLRTIVALPVGLLRSLRRRGRLGLLRAHSGRHRQENRKMPIRSARFFMTILCTAQEQRRSPHRAAPKKLRSVRSIRANPSAAERELPPRRRSRDAKIRCVRRAGNCAPGAEGCARPHAGRAARRRACRRQSDARSRQSARGSGACVPYAARLRPACSGPGARSRASRFARGGPCCPRAVIRVLRCGSREMGSVIVPESRGILP